MSIRTDSMNQPDIGQQAARPPRRRRPGFRPPRWVLAVTAAAAAAVAALVVDSAGSMAVAGLSEGGLCATTLALNYPGVYTAFGNYSGNESPTYQYDNTQQTIQTLFGGSQASYDAHNPAYILAHQRFTGLAGWFAAGAQDSTGSLQAARTLHALAAKAGIDSRIQTPPGARNFSFWTQAFKDSPPWLSWKLKLPPEPGSIPAQCVSGQS